MWGGGSEVKHGTALQEYIDQTLCFSQLKHIYMCVCIYIISSKILVCLKYQTMGDQLTNWPTDQHTCSTWFHWHFNDQQSWVFVFYSYVLQPSEHWCERCSDCLNDCSTITRPSRVSPRCVCNYGYLSLWFVPSWLLSVLGSVHTYCNDLRWDPARCSVSLRLLDGSLYWYQRQ